MKNYDYQISHPTSIDPSLDIDVSDPSSYDAARSARLQRFGQGSWSPGNPYVEQMQYARNRQDMAALKQQAIEWEANQQQYQQQLADQERMSDPHYQLQRQRAAGINPDISGGSGGSSAGASVSPPAMADTELTELSSPYKTADRVFSGMQSASSLISSVSTAMLQGVEFAKNVATFGDMLSMSDSSKRAAKASADVAEGTVDARIDSIEQLAAGGKLELYGMIADSLPEVEGGHTQESITKHLESLGIDSKHSPGVFSYTQSPAQQKLRSDQRSQVAMARAKEAAAGYDHYLRIEQNQAKMREAQSVSDLQMSNFEKILTLGAFSDDQAVLESDIINQGRENESLQSAYTHEQLVSDIAAWKEALNMRHEQVKRLNELIDKYSGLSTPEATSIVSTAMLFRTQLLALTSKEFGQISHIGQQVTRMEYVASEALGQFGFSLPGWSLASRPSLNFFDMAYATDWAQDPQTAMNAVDKVFDVMKFVLKKSRAGRVARVLSSGTP